MKLERRFVAKTIFYLVVWIGLFLFVQNSSASTISGIVFNNRNAALASVNVEIYNDFYQLLGKTLTDGTGRYKFTGLRDGTYTVKVLPFRYDYEEQSQMVIITTLGVRGAGLGNTFIVLDFYLSPKKGSFEDVENSVVFVQEIPKEAKKFYEKSIEDFSKNRRTEALDNLNEAIKIFPTYFLALNLLGREYVLAGKYGEAAPILLRAVDVNPKSPTALYFLGYSLHKLNYNKAALVALNQAYILSPTWVAVLWTLGTVNRLEKNYADAEKFLVQAKKLTQTPIPEIHFELAKLYGENLKKFSNAADELEAFLKARPDAKDAVKIREMIKTLREKAKSQLR